jgi:hypothetical protein
LVASKSGGTLETLSFCSYFYDRLASLRDCPGENFIALTDPGSQLERLAEEKGFCRIFSTPPEVGGRFSALTEFGLVPAALLGLPLEEVVGQAAAMAAACGPGIPEADNPALQLGAFLGGLAAAGRDQLSLLLAPGLRPFAVWLEQLLAESTGKKGRGLVPLIMAGDEPEFLPPGENRSRMGLFIGCEGDDDEWLKLGWEAFAKARVPAARLTLPGPTALGAELWRFEMATAAAAIELQINPFDQPDVESAKVRARDAIRARRQQGVLPEPPRLGPEEAGLRVSGSPHFAASDSLETGLSAWLSAARPGDYLALLAYLPPVPEIECELEKLKIALELKSRLPVCLGFGPRYLHSTGQLHKGGANRGLFLMLAGELDEDRPLPGEEFGFATLVAAQYRGDFQALSAAGRRILLVEGAALSGREIVAAVGSLLGRF